MKKVFFALAAVVALAACSKEQTVTFDEGNAIGFDTFVENATRSVYNPSLTDEGLKSTEGFGVYGFVTGDDVAPIFENEQVKYVDAQGGWVYTNTQYWIPGASYDFAAIAPYDAYNNVTATTSGVTLSFTNDYKTDLLYAQKNGVTGPDSNGAVGLSFRHTLSKVRFSFENTYDATNTVIKVRDIKVLNAYKSGDVELTANATTWKTDNLVLDPNPVVFGNATQDTSAEDAAADAFGNGTTLESNKQLLLIPANYPADGKFQVEFTYDIIVAGKTIKSFTEDPEVAVNLQPGYSYDFKATITPGDRIEFTVTEVKDWVLDDEEQTL